MNHHYRDRRKIDPMKAPTPGLKGDNTPDDNDRIEIGPTALAYAEWEAAGLELPDLQALRHYRHRRLVDAINARGYGGLLVFDPLNIRYATDSTNMQLWNTHNPFRALMVCADGYMVMWDYKNSPFLSTFNPLVREQRSGADFFYFDRGDKIAPATDSFSKEVRDLINEHGGGNMRLGVDKIMIHGLRALEAHGFTVIPGEELTEKARAVKGPDEIKAMRCASVACEEACYAMEAFAREHMGDG
ncbi:MAG: aminopeptidase P family N-terminal domain-containing protein, partial [Pseudomonadota bacterium]